MGEVAMRKGADGADTAQKESGSGKNSAPKSGSVGLTWKKENEGCGPAGHREIGEGGDHAGAGSATEAQFQPP